VTTYNNLISRTDAAALIPEDVATDIIKALPQKSAALTQFRKVRMSRGQQRMPVVSALPTAYWVDGTNDAGLKQTSEVNWGNQYLDARELAVIVPVPQAVLDDSAFDIWAEVKPLLIEAFGSAIDAAALFGTNAPSGWPTSLVQQAVAAGNYVTEGTALDSKGHNDFGVDVSAAMGKVEQDGFDALGFWARRKVKARLRDLRDSNGVPIYQPIAGGNPATLYGEQLTFVGNEPWVNNYELITGDPNYAILGVRQDIEFKVFTEGVISDGAGAIVLNLMQQDSAALRAVMRVAFQVANPITRDNTGNTRFPFAVVINAGS
jgi:HK97 family phage major capsid protein